MSSRQSNMEHTAHALCEQLRNAGFQALWAGGCVRDRLMNRPFKDIDIATDAHPDAVLTLFPKAVEVGKQFGVVRVLRDDLEFEIATFRKDFDYTDGRRPGHVVFCTAEEDAARRDFTINGMFYDPLADRILDTVGGRADLKAGIIRAIGDPTERFQEDRLRLLRAVRFEQVLSFHLEPATEQAVREQAAHVTDVSWERIRNELSRLLTESTRPGDAVRRMDALGLLSPVLPEVAALKGVDQPPEFHPEGDVYTHTLLMLNGLDRPDLRLALATLLHDIGKPPTRMVERQPDGAERIRFPNHANRGERITREILERLKYPNRIIDDVAYCVKNHMRFIDAPKMRESTLRRFLGAETFDLELELHRLDCEHSHGGLDIYEHLKARREAYANEPVLPEPLVRGRDLIDAGLTPGPSFGPLLKELYDHQLEHPDVDKATLLKRLPVD